MRRCKSLLRGANQNCPTLGIKLPEETRDKKLSSHAKVVVIGGGVVGRSILFHLAKFGWKDVVLPERNELTSGSSWHAAGQIHMISSDPNISRLQSYTIDLYKKLRNYLGILLGFISRADFIWHRIKLGMII